MLLLAVPLAKPRGAQQPGPPCGAAAISYAASYGGDGGGDDGTIVELLIALRLRVARADEWWGWRRDASRETPWNQAREHQPGGQGSVLARPGATGWEEGAGPDQARQHTKATTCLA